MMTKVTDEGENARRNSKQQRKLQKQQQQQQKQKSGRIDGLTE